MDGGGSYCEPPPSQNGSHRSILGALMSTVLFIAVLCALFAAGAGVLYGRRGAQSALGQLEMVHGRNETLEQELAQARAKEMSLIGDLARASEKADLFAKT